MIEADSRTEYATQETIPSQAATGEERIRIRAYELYQKRGDQPGDPESDWYRAEAELKGAAGQAKK